MTFYVSGRGNTVVVSTIARPDALKTTSRSFLTEFFKMKIPVYTFLACLVFAVSLYAQPQVPDMRASLKPETKPSLSIASATAGFKKYEGYFTFCYDEKSGKVYLEVDKLDKEFLYFTSLSNGVGNGGPERGQASSSIAKFMKVGPKILLVEPVYNFRAISSNTDQLKAVENNFAKSVIFGFVPVAVEEDTYLVDITSFIIRDSQNITGRLGVSRVSGPVSLARSSGPSTSYRLDDSRSIVYIANTKNFPENTEFESMLTFTGNAAPVRCLCKRHR
jgi:hypothetical protein